MPMMKIGSHRLPELMVIGPIVDALRDQHDRERDRQQIDREGPQHVEQARQDQYRRCRRRSRRRCRPAPPATRQISGRGAGDQQRVAAAIEQARQRRRGPGCRRRGNSGRSSQVGPIGVKPRPSPSVDGLHDRHVLAVDLDLAVEVGAERIGAGDPARHRPAPAGRRATISSEDEQGPPWRRGRARSLRTAIAQGPCAARSCAARRQTAATGRSSIRPPRQALLHPGLRRPSSRTGVLNWKLPRRFETKSRCFGVNSGRGRRLVGDALVDLGPQLVGGRLVGDAELPAPPASRSSISLSQKPAMLIELSEPSRNESQPNRTLRKSEAAG